MKNQNGIMIIGVDHGYGNIKTANCCFPTGIMGYESGPGRRRRKRSSPPISAGTKKSASPTKRWTIMSASSA